jgi:hypothetical protein
MKLAYMAGFERAKRQTFPVPQHEGAPQRYADVGPFLHTLTEEWIGFLVLSLSFHPFFNDSADLNTVQYTHI